jgi:hypothetical protein
MAYKVCAKCVSLQQTYEAAGRLEYAPTTHPVVRVKAHAVRVRTRKAMISHSKICDD